MFVPGLKIKLICSKLGKWWLEKSLMRICKRWGKTTEELFTKHSRRHQSKNLHWSKNSWSAGLNSVRRICCSNVRLRTFVNYWTRRFRCRMSTKLWKSSKRRFSFAWDSHRCRRCSTITLWFRKRYVLRIALLGGFGNQVIYTAQAKYLGRVKVLTLVPKTSFGRRISQWSSL